MPAMLAEVSVLMIPEIKALSATLAMRPPCPGASCERTPIWMPTEPMLPQPQRAYVTMSFERAERVAYSAWEVSAAY